jgi:hypothetical protein
LVCAQWKLSGSADWKLETGGSRGRADETGWCLSVVAFPLDSDGRMQKQKEARVQKAVFWGRPLQPSLL